MAIGPMSELFRNLRRALRLSSPEDSTDGQLLERFRGLQDEAAFEGLVERHGPMVLGVCRRMLQDSHEAEDAFQATFLILVRKANSIRPPEMVGNWLYGVACRTSLNAKATTAKRRKKEQEMREIARSVSAGEAGRADLQPLLDAELQRLPDKYRASIVLCDLEGKSREEAARQLGVPEGTLSSRLARAREMLGQRLTRRGLVLPASAVAVTLAQTAAPAAVPAPLLAATVQAGTGLAAGQAVGTVASASVVTMMEGVLKAMFVTKLKIAAAVLVALGSLGTGAGVVAHRAFAQRAPVVQSPGATTPLAAADVNPLAPDDDEQNPFLADAKPGNKEDKKKADAAGVVVAVSPDGKRFTIELAPKNKGDEATKLEIKLTDQTAVTYFNVPPNGAKPTEGYSAAVNLEAGSADTAARVSFITKKTGKEPDLAGKVVAVADGGKRITIEASAKKKGQDAEKIEIKFSDKTALVYSGVAKGGARPAEGYDVQVWLAEGSKDTARRVQFNSGKEKEGIDRKPDLSGQVVAVADGRITVEAAPKVKGEQAKRIDIKILDVTRMIFHGVGPEGAKPAAGLAAAVWLADGTTDTAVRVGFFVKEKGPDLAGYLADPPQAGERLVVTVPAKVKGDEASRSEIAINAQAHITYSGVGPDGAKPTAGYHAQVWLAEGSKDTAAEVRLDFAVKQKPAEDPKGKPAKKDDAKDDPRAKPANGDPKEKPSKDDPKEKPAKNDPKEKPAKNDPKEKPAKDDPKEIPAKDAAKPAPADDKGKPGGGKIVFPLPSRDPLPIAAAIDREIDRRLSEAKIRASPTADDAEFLRRVCLDISGRIPSLDRTAAFLDSTDPDKRRHLIDELLVSSEYGQHVGTIWRNLIAPRNTTGTKAQADTFTPWLAEQFNRNRGWHEIVSELLTAEGEVRTNPQTAFVMANSEDFQPQPNLLAGSSVRLFLGVQLQCAECHDHPFAHWKQRDFWATAAFFGRLRNGGLKGQPFTLTEALDPQPHSAKKGEIARPTAIPGGGIVIPTSAGRGAGQTIKAKFPGGAEPALDDQKPLRPSFAAWATAADNPFFAQAFVNRTWGQFFGRGFVNPVDNFADDRAASHPPLLKLLADEFKASGHDVKHLVRCICNSRAYQRTSRPLAENESDRELCSHMAVKPLTPEAFYDSLVVVLNVSQIPRSAGPKPAAAKGKEAPPATKGAGLGSRDDFVAHFRTQGDSAEPGEFTQGIPQFLRRMNAPGFNAGAGVVERLTTSSASKDQAIEGLYLATLSRRPTAEEKRLLAEYVSKRGDAEKGYAGVLWILLNSSEFVLNH